RAYRHAGAAGDLSRGEGPGAPVRGPAAGRVPRGRRAGGSGHGRECGRRDHAGHRGAGADRARTRMSPRRATLIVVVTELLVGCTVGPNYRRPEVPVPATWRQAEQRGVGPGLATVTVWWRTFEDPVLDRLVEQAVVANLDLKVATARVREA